MSARVYPTRSSGPSMETPDESWTDTLALAIPGKIYVVDAILFDLVRRRCLDLGCREGSELLCTENDHEGVSFLTRDGFVRRLEREYAWFIRVASPTGRRSAARPE